MATLEERKAKRREQKKLYKREERARENAEKAKTHARILHLRANYSKKRPRADADDAEDAQPAAAPRAPAVRPVVPPARPLTATPSRRRRTPSRDEVVDGRPSLPPQPALTAPVERTEARPPSPEPTAVHAVPPEPGPNDTVRLQYTRSACMEAGDDPVQAGTYMGIVVETKGAKAKVYWYEVDGEPYPGDLDNPSWELIEGLEVVSVGDHSSRFRKPTAFLHENAAVVSDNESDDDDDDNTRGRRANSSKITAAAKAAGLVVVTLEHHGNNSHRRRTLGPGGFKPDAGDAKAIRCVPLSTSLPLLAHRGLPLHRAPYPCDAASSKFVTLRFVRRAPTVASHAGRGPARDRRRGGRRDRLPCLGGHPW
mmetsp:Transcript_11950/g.35716  ORF Transcript_11950/g.35716 Transcript_11950/m.35716 type:complete len:368 (-) Transcript_11950:365-1468(-)